MKAPQRRWNGAQEKAFSSSSFLAKRRPSKAAVQAFKDGQNKKKRFPGKFAHYGRLIT